MGTDTTKKRVAIIGGGPSGMFMYKRLTEQEYTDFDIYIFEKKKQLGAGMPYSTDGARVEHVTNVSGNEIPEIVTYIKDWVQTLPNKTLEKYNISRNHFNDYKVLPRLLFGEYLSAQFDLLLKNASEREIATTIHNTTVIDVIDKGSEVCVKTEDDGTFKFDHVIICTGHVWPTGNEKNDGYFDSPYPPSKITLQLNHPVAIKGSSLTAIDAIRTLARCNGQYVKDDHGLLHYHLNPESKGFKMCIHSRSGLLPAVRFHLEDTHLTNDSLLSFEELMKHRQQNGGFLSLDYVFEKDFKDIFKEKDPAFYDKIKDMVIEDFVAHMMSLREEVDAFNLLEAEYKEAEKSIRRHESIYWKEMLGVLSFAMNYPAKYFSAEDMIRLQKVLMPLITIVIAYVPQSSTLEMLALYKAGLLNITAVGTNSTVTIEDEGGATYRYTNNKGENVEVHYKTFIDCTGQPHLQYSDFPFKSLINDNVISPALIKFKSGEEALKQLEQDKTKVTTGPDGEYYLKVSGIAINDNFQVTDSYGAYNNRVYVMAVPFIGGYNPDYSGLDFSEKASQQIINAISDTIKVSSDTI